MDRALLRRFWLVVLACASASCGRGLHERGPLLPAGAAPPGPPDVTPGAWSEFVGARPVLLLEEPRPRTSGGWFQSAARLVAFADGRVMLQAPDEHAHWRWYVERYDAPAIAWLRHQTLAELRRVPRRVSCDHGRAREHPGRGAQRGPLAHPRGSRVGRLRRARPPDRRRAAGLAAVRRDGCWNVEVVREAPADAVLACVARRRGLGCRRVPAAPDR